MAGSAVCGDGQKYVARYGLFSIARRTGGRDRSANFHLTCLLSLQRVCVPGSATPMTCLVSRSNLELSKNCVMRMTHPPLRQWSFMPILRVNQVTDHEGIDHQQK